MDPVIETARLFLRIWSLDDVEAAYEIYRDPEVMRFIGNGAPIHDIEETRRRVQRRIDHQERHGFGFWAMIEKASGQLVGACGLKHLEDNGPEIEVGYHLARAVWGRGYATEAARASLDYGFRWLALDRIVGVVHPANRASQRVLEKIGMTLEGTGHYYGGEALCYAATRPQ